jgi:hypothetical protein
VSEEKVGESRSHDRSPRLIAGLFLAPIVGCLLGAYAFLIVVLLTQAANQEPDQLDLQNLIRVFGMITGIALQIALLLGVAISFAFGLPLYLLLKHFEITHVLAYLSGGIAVGVVALQIFFMLSATDFGMETYVAPLGAACGGFAALTFWLIRRPDKDAGLNHSASNSTSA